MAVAMWGQLDGPSAPGSGSEGVVQGRAGNGFGSGCFPKSPRFIWLPVPWAFRRTAHAFRYTEAGEVVAVLTGARLSELGGG